MAAWAMDSIGAVTSTLASAAGRLRRRLDGRIGRAEPSQLPQSLGRQSQPRLAGEQPDLEPRRGRRPPVRDIEPRTARWTQTFSYDEGATSETNWIMDVRWAVK